MRIASVASGTRMSYLFGPEGSGPLVAVDPGTEVEALVAAARGRTIERVVVTSGFGHLASLKAVQEATGASVLAHRMLLLHLADAGLERLVPLWGGMELSIGNVPYRVIACPGVDDFAIALHVGGSYVFTGETLLVGACGRLDGPGANRTSLYVSLGLLTELPGDTEVLAGRDAGHGTRSTIAAEKARNPALTAESLEAFLALR